MADALQIKLEGVDELKRALAGAAVHIRTRAVRSALREAGRVIQAAARAAAPVLKAPRKNRKPGTIKQNIVVRASKFARQSGDEGVYINVRGLRGRARVKKFGKAGAENPNDPYYWHFVEFGHRFVPRAKSAPKAIYGSTLVRMKNGTTYRRALKRNATGLRSLRAGAIATVPARPFMRPAAASKVSEAIAKFMQSVVPQIEKLNQRSKIK